MKYIIAIMLLTMAFSSVKANENIEAKAKLDPSICGKLQGISDAWYDRAHTYLSVQFCEPSAWFDGFFSDDRNYEEYRPGTRVRWQNDYVYTEHEGFEYQTKFSASFKLPNAKKKINLFFEGEEEESLNDIFPDNEKEIKSDFGLLYQIRDNVKANLSLRIKLSPSITLRYRYLFPENDGVIKRFTQEIYRRDNAYGATSRMDFEKKLSDDFVLRQSNQGVMVDNRRGLEWSTSLVLYQHLSDVSALSYESGVSGNTRPERYVGNTRIGIRYRRNFFRQWLFYEIAPALTWPRSPLESERKQVWEVLFRLEINFINL